MTLEELEAWEAEVKVTCLINPMKFDDSDMLELTNYRIPLDDPQWEPLSIPIIAKTVYWYLANDGCNDTDSLHNNNLFWSVIAKYRLPSQTKYSVMRKYLLIIKEYIKWKNNLGVEKQNGKLNQWFNRNTKAG
jgi:hypothetical protein